MDRDEHGAGGEPDAEDFPDGPPRALGQGQRPRVRPQEPREQILDVRPDDEREDEPSARGEAGPGDEPPHDQGTDGAPTFLVGEPSVRRRKEEDSGDVEDERGPRDAARRHDSDRADDVQDRGDDPSEIRGEEDDRGDQEPGRGGSETDGGG